MTNSKQKGKVGELQWVHFCKDQGYDGVYRGQQYNGAKGNADVEGLPLVHCEVKRSEKLNLYDALDQSRRDARKGEIPIVAHRKNDHRWVVIMDANDWFELYREWQSGQAIPFSEPPLSEHEAELLDLFRPERGEGDMCD
jgi:hypothetical protein